MNAHWYSHPLFFLIILCFLQKTTHAQTDPLERHITIAATGITLGEALNRISAAADFSISYHDAALDLAKVVDIRFDSTRVADALQEVLGNDVRVVRTGGNKVLIRSPRQQDLAEVVVTASRVRESIDEVPSAVTVLGAATIEQQMNINNSISEILGYTVPGLGPSTNKATNSGQTLRGRSVLVLLDGVPQSTPLMNGNRDIRSLDPAIIERVEVIKGATAIYGNGSGEGIINYITEVPAADRKISGRTTLGTNAHALHPGDSVGYRFSQSFD